MPLFPAHPETCDPFVLFAEWFADARGHPAVPEANAMALATATASGLPSARMVLLKGHDTRGFTFYTHLDGRKSGEIHENPHASLCLYWQPLQRQIRIEGRVEPVSDAEADAYFNSRPLISRLGAIASQQSRPLDARKTLTDKVQALEAQYSDANPPPRPSHWSGWRVVPDNFEFWQAGDYRLHDRARFNRTAGGWEVTRLYP